MRDLWRAAVWHDPDGRRPARLLNTETYEVWVIGWTTGQHVRPHDHGRSAGALVVVAGEHVRSCPRPARPMVERALAGGRVRHVPVGTVHDVMNRAPAPATSLHVYSPPLSSMTYYDPATLAPVRSEAIIPSPPVLGSPAASYVLHPSQRRARS